METAVAFAIAAGAVVFVVFVNRKNEAQTNMRANAIAQAKADALPTGGDAAAVVGTAVATYFGGPKAGAAVWSASGERL